MENDKYLKNLNDVAESIKKCPNRKEKCTVLIGAGCSVSAGIPTSSGIIEKIREDFPEVYKKADPKTYSKCMEELGPGERRDLINGYVENAKINWAHLCLAKLMDEGYVDRILTTNFDPLALRACALLGFVPAVYDITSFAVEFDPSIIPDKSIFYLHGQWTGFKLVHTDEEGRANIRNLLPFFKDSLPGRTWIVVGYSGADPVFDELVKVNCFRRKLFWVCHGDEPDSHIRKNLLVDDKFAFYLKQFDADDFFIKLTQKLGCFPEIATKPFSHIKLLLKMLTNYPLAGGEDTKDITKEGIQIIEKAIEEYEIQPSESKILKEVEEPELMYVTGLFANAKYDELINLINDEISTKSSEWRELKSYAFFMKGLSLLQKSEQKYNHTNESLIDEAIKLFDEAIKLKSQYHIYLRYKGDAILHKAVFTSGKQKDELLDQAIWLYDETIKLEPKNPVCLNNKGVALYIKAKRKSGEEKENLLNEIINLYNKAMSLKPDYPDYLHHKGAALYEKANLKFGKEKENLLDEAISLYDKAINIKPEKSNCLSDKANALYEKAKQKFGKEKENLLDEAINLYTKAIKLNPKESFYLNNKSNAFLQKAEIKSGTEKEDLLEEAIGLCDEAVKLKPEDPFIKNSKGKILFKKAKLKSGNEKENLFVQSEELLNKAEEIYPGLAAYNLGCLMALTGREQECKEWLYKSLEKNSLPSLNNIEKDDDLKEYKDKDWFKSFLLKVKEKQGST